jgi:hypothetical protein
VKPCCFASVRFVDERICWRVALFHPDFFEIGFFSFSPSFSFVDERKTSHETTASFLSFLAAPALAQTQRQPKRPHQIPSTHPLSTKAPTNQKP